MTAAPRQLDELARRLYQSGIAAFCPTTLSVGPEALAQTVTRLGAWIKKTSTSPDPESALPIGIHLEGPFIHRGSCGAHPPSALRKLTMKELERLWKLSQGTLKILTVAPETLSPSQIKLLVSWCRKRQILLSLGHSRATEEQANVAFKAGFSGVTHAWNALSFHHRSPGPLGAAIGRDGVYLELIIDQVHVSPTLIRWTRRLHGDQPLCFVSDCVPAAATASDSRAGPWHRFGPLKTRQEKGACRLPDGLLAGGGVLLPEAICRWIETESKETGLTPVQLLRDAHRHWFRDPLQALRLNRFIKNHASRLQIQWFSQKGRLVAVARSRLD